LGVFVFPSMVKSLGLAGSLLLFGTTSLLALLISITTVKETKKKKLEEVSLGKATKASNRT